MMARLAERHDFVVSDQLLGVYVLHPRSWSVSQSLEDSRRVGLRRLREYLDLETLTDEEREDAVLGCVGELMTAQYWGALGAIFKGEGTPQLRRDLTQSGAMFAGLLGARRSPGERFAHLVVTSLAGLSEAPPSRTMGLALRGALKISGAIDRLATRPRRRTAAEEAALAEVGALDRSADAFFERLPAS